MSDTGTDTQAALVPLEQLFARLRQEVAEKQPANQVFFLVDFLCRHYPQHLHGFAQIWNAGPFLERDRMQVVEFFNYCKIPPEMAAHFTAAGFDTLETLCTLSVESLDEVERFNDTTWLPGHKVRLQQVFSDIAGRVRAYRIEREKMLHMARISSGRCDHGAVLTRTTLPPVSDSCTLDAASPAVRLRWDT
ncbi:MAG: uncharacterized protein KVP18_002469 [Porospora cf. gigantea A]|uniref:uncharacterized protein n=1 Tax=Porospora cf. gigantea A TaxID=2853593 RepID=UPI0035595C2F|nr:MAG: hypothetical protein KVP18_002469 [Porospora cf. gigantea A]